MTSVRATDLAAPNRGNKAILWRLGAIVLFLGLPLGALSAIAFAMLAGLDARDRADHAEETARAIVRQLGQRPSAITKPLDTTSLYLKSSTASLAQAELQALVSARIEAAGGHLVQLQPLDTTDQDAPGRVAVEITFDAGNQTLLDGLHALETGVPILTVPRLDAQAQAPADGSGGAGDLLRVTMTVQGLWKVPTP